MFANGAVLYTLLWYSTECVLGLPECISLGIQLRTSVVRHINTRLREALHLIVGRAPSTSLGDFLARAGISTASYLHSTYLGCEQKSVSYCPPDWSPDPPVSLNCFLRTSVQDSCQIPVFKLDEFLVGFSSWDCIYVLQGSLTYNPRTVSPAYSTWSHRLDI